MEKNNLTRRKFVAGTTGAATAAMIVPRHVLGGPGYIAPNDKVNVAVIGCGGQGASDATELVKAGENIVALADVDFGYVDKAVAAAAKGRDGNPNPDRVALKEAYDKAARFTDYRKMLDEQKNIDAVIVATPDHIHAIAAKHSLEAGKHVYCEKPLTWSVQEARVLRETAAKNPKLITQMGNQGHSNDEARLINEWVQAGIIGPVKEVFIWTNRPIWPQGIPRPGKPPVNAEPGGFGNDWTDRMFAKAAANGLMMNEFSKPETLNWDLYLGPAPLVDYHPIYHPFNWRGWVDYGTGALGDMAAHLMDHPYWALDLRYPETIEATSTPWGEDNKRNIVSHPRCTQVVYHFPARGKQPPVKMIWCDGGLMAPRPEWLPESVPLERGGGVIIQGSKGMLMHDTYGKKPRLFPESLMEAAKKVPQKYERAVKNDKGDNLHRVMFANAIKGKNKPVEPFEYASRLTETMLLGIVALKTGQGVQIRWDGEAGKVTNNAKANEFLHREYRKGWTL